MLLRIAVGIALLHSCACFPYTLEDFASDESVCTDDRQDCSMPDAAPQMAMLQTRFEKPLDKALLDTQEQLEAQLEKLVGKSVPDIKAKHSKSQLKSLLDTQALDRQGKHGTQALAEVRNRRKSVESLVFRWGIDPDSKHPKSIGKWWSANFPQPAVQNYEATLPYLTGMVLNIFGKKSNGEGGLLLALEVPSPCDATQWLQVDTARCSSRYPCALRLPAGAVRGTEAQPIKFRTRVVTADEDYLTDFLEYERVTIDHDAEVTVLYQGKLSGPQDAAPAKRRTLKFDISPVLASGALTVTPVIQGATAETVVSMKIRQPTPPAHALLQEEHASDGMQALENTLQSYRKSWADTWREPATPIQGCGHELFEVVADQLYPGTVELEVWTSDGSPAVISDVLISTRVSWADAEVQLLDSILKDHFGFFNDPAVFVHGLPMDAYAKENPGRIGHDSNPTSWGYAMESWLIMAETGVLKPEEAVAKLKVSFQTLQQMQSDPEAFIHGLFYPYFTMRSRATNEEQFPTRTDLKDLPCGDDALFYSSLLVVQGWLTQKQFKAEADICAEIIGRMDFSHCIRTTDCNKAGNGQLDDDPNADGDKFWAVPLTVHADTLEPHSFNWNVFADEGGVVAMVVAMSGGVNDAQYESIVKQQQKYSPCGTWEGVTVGHTAFFNSIFTLPTRSLMGLGTLYASPYYHEFAVRTVLPSFRAHQKLKKKIGADYMGPSDAMTQTSKYHPDRIFGSYAYWPPNNFYDCRKKVSIAQNQCTWCRGQEMEGVDDPFDMIVPHGSMVSFLNAAMMEKSQFSSWLEDAKMLITDVSGVYTPGYGFEVVAPAKRTPLGGGFSGASAGRGIWESLSHGYTILSMYEGLATMRRRYELAKEAGWKVPGSYEPPNYKPLSDFINVLPEMRTKVDKLLAVASQQVSTERQCGPSDYGPAGKY